jgi:hypothetical protein
VLSSSTSTRPTTTKGINMNVQDAQETIDALDVLIHQLSIEIDTLSGRIAQASDQRRTILNAAPELLLDAARRNAATHTPNRIVSFPGRSRRSHGPEWISPLDERGDYSGWDDAA